MRIRAAFFDFGHQAAFTVSVGSFRHAVGVRLRQHHRIPFKQRIQAKATLHDWVRQRR